MTISRFDPLNLGQYEEAPELLHFQWIGKKCNNKVYRYALVDIIEPNDIDAELKQTKTEKNLSQKEIKDKYINGR